MFTALVLSLFSAGFELELLPVFLESLPVTENGKLSRKLIVERCSGLIRSSADLEG